MNHTPPSKSWSHTTGSTAGDVTTTTTTTKKKKILLPPYPISIELYNAVPNYHSIVSSSSAESSDRNTMRKGRSLLYRPEYSTKLLSPIHLDITITTEVGTDIDSNNNNNNNNSNDDENHQHNKSSRTHSDPGNGRTTTEENTDHENMLPSSKVILYSGISSSSSSSSCCCSAASVVASVSRYATGSDTKQQQLLLPPPPSSTSFISTWLHINDVVSEDRWHMLRTTPTIYESIQARFATIRTTTTTTTLHPNTELERNDRIVPPTTNTPRSEFQYFLEMNIHPSRLCRIPPSFLGTNHTHTNSTTGNTSIYDRLPVNCVVVRFSDQTLRIHPSHYQLLDTYYQFYNLNHTLVNHTNNMTSPSKKTYGEQITTTNNNNNNTLSSPKHTNPNMSLSMNGSFFEDDVFHALDGVISHQPNTITTTTDLTKSIRLDDDANNNDTNDDIDLNHTLSLSSSLHHSSRNGNAYMNGTRLDAFSDPHSNPTTATRTYDDEYTATTATTMDKLSFMSLLDSKGNFEIAVGSEMYVPEGRQPETVPDADVLQSDVIDEIDCLEKQIELEAAALLEEQRQFRTDVMQVRSLMEQIRMVEKQNIQISHKVSQVQMNQYRDAFILEAQRIRLIREVARIYPITVVRNVHYSIHGLEIPFDLYSGNISEEVISAAFGFLCHTTYLISKYLGIHIRYRLHCQSSRSAIQDTNGSTFPLFPGRQVEREQFEYGVHLLHRNIDCICKCRGIQQRSIQPSHQIHILAKILRIFDNVNDGY